MRLIGLAIMIAIVLAAGFFYQVGLMKGYTTGRSHHCDPGYPRSITIPSTTLAHIQYINNCTCRDFEP